MRDLSALFGPWALPQTVADAVRWSAIEAEHMVRTWAPIGSTALRAACDLRLALCDAPDHLLTIGWPRPSSAQADCESCGGAGIVLIGVCVAGRHNEVEEPCEDCGGTGTRAWASCARCRRLCDPDDLEPSAAGWTCDACRGITAAPSPHLESPCRS